MKKSRINTQIILAVGVNAAQTLVCMRNGATAAAEMFAVVSCALYIILTNVLSRGRVPEEVRIAYVSAAAVQILLNIIGLVPEPNKMFGGIEQLMYCVLLIAAATVGGIANSMCRSAAARSGQSKKHAPNE